MRVLKSLTRGLRALDILETAGGPVRLTDLASSLGVEKSNASHILKTLVAMGYAEQDSSRRYQLAWKQRLADDRQDALDDVISCRDSWRPILEALVDRTGECAHFAVRVRSQVWYIDKVDSLLPLKVDHPIGSLAPLHCTALGKAFLAFSDAQPEDPLTYYTQATITSLDGLQRELQQTRERGYAIDDEEYASGIRCVAAPVFDRRNEMIAAIGISGPTVRIDDARLLELGGIILAQSRGDRRVRPP
ncbi:MAG: IclR family transcriptional regulator [Paracoccaceae bacterium]|nr:IclR family transcriptional regulator [Paracoccaceae bacterium]